MKTAVSIPDDIFAAAEELVSRLQLSRSNLSAQALAEFVARHDADQVTALMNQAVLEVRAGEPDAAFSQKAAKQVIRRIEW